jgi:hypothetical protein
MEISMFAEFCAKSIMQATIQRLSDLDGWKDSTTIMERSFRTAKRGTYMCAYRGRRNEGLVDEAFEASKAATSRLKPLDRAIQAAMESQMENFHCPDEVYFQDRVTIHNHEFTTYRTSESLGVIFFKAAAGANSLVPGMIRAIFLTTQDSAEHIFLAVHRYLAHPTSLPNPFARYPDFGASLWSSAIQEEITIVPGSRDIYHAIYRDWDHGIKVMKPLNRVSKYHLAGK